MRERPIIFSAPMVRAILDGRKTQTRRVVRVQPPAWAPFPQPAGDGWEWTDRDVDADDLRHWPDYYKPMRCPYGVPGDRLWVRETWQPFYDGGAIYLADAGTHRLNARTEAQAKANWPGWKSPRFMPRRHSRITLEVTGVRVERVQEISEADAEAEGPSQHPDWPRTFHSTWRYAFRDLWDSINEKRGNGWGANPWVWVVEFRRAA